MERSKPLDCLRTLAIILVLGRHLVEPCPAAISPFLHALTEIWARGGWIGVDLFFVLSGFLVSGLLFREYQSYGGIRAKRFLIRRGFKIYPAFWLLISASIIVRVFIHHPPQLRSIVMEFLFLQNYNFINVWGHTWSLAVEEHFYCFLLIFLLCLSRFSAAPAPGPRNPFKFVPFACLILAVLCFGLRWLTLYLVPYGPDGESYAKHFFPTHLRMDALFFGVLISYWYHYYPERFFAVATRCRWWFCLAGLLLLSLPFFFELGATPGLAVWGYTLLSLGSGLLLSGSLMIRLPPNRFFRSVAYIGSHSYSIYLWHVPVEVASDALFRHDLLTHNSWLLYALTYLLGSLLFGIAMALLVEFPVLKLRNRWFPPRKESASPREVSPPDLIPAK